MVIGTVPNLCAQDSTLDRQGQILCLMNNPFKKGDKVTIKLKGQVVEATVSQTWNEEVQVRTPDNKLLWRVPKTVTLVEAAPAGDPAAAATEPKPSKTEAGNASPSANAVTRPATTGQPTPSPKSTSKSASHKKNSGQSVPYKRTRPTRNKRRKI